MIWDLKPGDVCYYVDQLSYDEYTDDLAFELTIHKVTVVKERQGYSVEVSFSDGRAQRVWTDDLFDDALTARDEFIRSRRLHLCEEIESCDREIKILHTLVAGRQKEICYYKDRMVEAKKKMFRVLRLSEVTPKVEG